MKKRSEYPGQRLSPAERILIQDLIAACGPTGDDLMDVPCDGIYGTGDDYSEHVPEALTRPGVRWRFEALANRFESRGSRTERYGADPIDVAAWPEDSIKRCRSIGMFRDFLERLSGWRPSKELNHVELNILKRLQRAAGEPVCTRDLDHAAGLDRSSNNQVQKRKRAIRELERLGLIERVRRGWWRAVLRG